MKKNRNVEGTGLGLSIAKSFLDLMGGFVEVKSEYGKGSTFTVFIPLIPGDESQAVKRMRQEPVVAARSDTRVLVVDDSAINLTVAQGFLLRHNINAVTARGGYESIDMLKNALAAGTPFDLVFMDHMMPDIDGVETTQKIREMIPDAGCAPDYYQKLPIIALSANAVQGTEEMFLASGMNGFVSKPIDAANLNRALAYWLPREKISLQEQVDETAADAGTDDSGGAGADADKDVQAGALIKEEAPKERSNAGAALLSSALSGITGLNTEKGLYFFAGDARGYRSALRQFCMSSGEECRRLEACLAAADWNAYSRAAHALKGGLGTIGASELSEWAQKLDAAAKPADKPTAGFMTAAMAADMAANITAVIEETPRFTAGVNGLAQALRESGALTEPRPPREKASAERFKRELAALVAACDRGEPDAVDTVVDSLRALFYDEEADRALELVFELVETMDYSEAAPLVTPLLARITAEAAAGS
jgi:CheY-like chemotaxis protein